MKLEEYQFTAEEIEILQTYRDNQPDFRLKQRFLALLMVAEGGIDFVKPILGVSRKSLQRWFDKYYHQGIGCLNSFQYQPSQPRLSEQEQKELKTWVKKKPRHS